MAKALPETCLNCGESISDTMDYCPSCGQRNRKAKLPLITFLSDFFEDYFTVDAKFFRSIGKLVFAPGALTREFNRGKRKTYIAPFRLYIFISFLFFFLLALNNKYNTDFKENTMIEFADSDSEEDSAATDSLSNRNLALPADSIKRKGDDSIVTINIDESPEKSEIEEFLEEQVKKANENPELFVQTLFKSASITMFILLPFFGLLLFLFHFKKHKYYVEHLVHSVHFHSFLFVIFLFALLANWIFGWSGYGWIFLVAFIYLLLSLRASYSQTYLKASLKAFFLLPIYILFISISMVLVFFGAIILT